MSIIDSIQQVADEIDEIVKREYPEELGNLAAIVFNSMGTEPTARNWTENSENTRKKQGVAGKFHRNIDTGLLAEWASVPGNIVDDDWISRSPNPIGYKYANELGKFDDIGKTPDDEDWLERRLEENIIRELS